VTAIIKAPGRRKHSKSLSTQPCGQEIFPTTGPGGAGAIDKPKFCDKSTAKVKALQDNSRQEAICVIGGPKDGPRGKC
jgi:hypothetical protein